MNNWRRFFIKMIAWFYFLSGLVFTYTIVYTQYLQQPWLVGSNYVPANFTDPEMVEVYLPLLICILFIIEGSAVIFKFKKAYSIFLLALILYLVVSTLNEFLSFDYRFILHHRLIHLATNFIIAGVPILLILIEQKREGSKMSL